MQTINSAAELKKTIQQLELDRMVQGQILKEQFFITYESMKPVSLIKSTLKEITSSPYLMNNVFASALGLLGGFISKKTATGKSDNPVRNLLGSILQLGVTNFIVQHPVAIKLIGGFLIQYIFKKTKSIFPKSDK